MRLKKPTRRAHVSTSKVGKMPAKQSVKRSILRLAASMGSFEKWLLAKKY